MEQSNISTKINTGVLHSVSEGEIIYMDVCWLCESSCWWEE